METNRWTDAKTHPATSGCYLAIWDTVASRTLPRLSMFVNTWCYILFWNGERWNIEDNDGETVLCWRELPELPDNYKGEK